MQDKNVYFPKINKGRIESYKIDDEIVERLSSKKLTDNNTQQDEKITLLKLAFALSSVIVLMFAKKQGIPKTQEEEKSFNTKHGGREYFKIQKQKLLEVFTYHIDQESFKTASPNFANKVYKTALAVFYTTKKLHKHLTAFIPLGVSHDTTHDNISHIDIAQQSFTEFDIHNLYRITKHLCSTLTHLQCYDLAKQIIDDYNTLINHYKIKNTEKNLNKEFQTFQRCEPKCLQNIATLLIDGVNTDKIRDFLNKVKK